ncbi:hypothetical protein Btru_032442 [Bulinus truncatus]|nr:hypothetical protein Btru_032442 [Bulinus truncatus]
MEVGYVRPVMYEHQPYSSSFFYESLNIKKEPDTTDYLKKSTDSDCFYTSMDKAPYFVKGKPIFSECELTSWTNKHPQHWTKTEVLDWIFSVVETDKLDGSLVQGEAYREFTGETLFNMSKSEFERVDPNYGGKMYETFRNLINNICFEKPSTEFDVNLLDDFNIQNFDYTNRLNKDILDRVRPPVSFHSDSNCLVGNRRQDSTTDANSLKVIVKEDEMKVDIPELGIYPIDPDFHFRSTTFLSPQQPTYPYYHHQTLTSTAPSFSTTSSNVSLSSSLPNFPVSCMSSMTPRLHRMPTPSRLPTSVQHRQQRSSPSPRPPSASSMGSSPHRVDERDTGYSSDDSTCASFIPRLGSSSFDDMEVNDSFNGGHSLRTETHPSGNKLVTGKKSRNHATKNGNHLWEFVRDLLRDPKSNPKLLKWEDKENGVFRFVQSEAVAQLWGEKKNNPQMTYEKLSRAMRNQ